MASIKIKDFFNGKFFEIPKYQRGYSWEKENIRDLFDDIDEAIESNTSHYLGTIVLSKNEKDNESFYIVDGQQRVTTITMIINALINELSKDDSLYYKRFYVLEDKRYRLTPLGRDKDFFINLLNDNDDKPQNKSQRYLKEGYEEIKNKIDLISDKVNYLKVIEKLEIMEFVENTEGDAIRIFQTVNDRGKLLTNMEKAKSLLIYFSNRYLKKKLDDKINNCFSDIFEIYDDIKLLGEDLNINLIKNIEFNEDNIMRYHFVSYSDDNYDATAPYVLEYLKNSLILMRNKTDYSQMEDFITNYIESLLLFFNALKNIIDKCNIQIEYFKLFCILNLSATLYPLIVKLEILNILDKNLQKPEIASYTFLDLIELIDVRVYKTRGTDPRAEISKFAYYINTDTDLDEIQNWLISFNQRWMNLDEFRSNLNGYIYGNRALNHMFIEYCEELSGKKFSIDELKKIMTKVPNIEHILSQTPKFSLKNYGFKNNDDYVEHEHTLGNLTVLERSLNSSVQNKNPSEKVQFYDRSIFKSTKIVATEIDSKKTFNKENIKNRTKILSDFCLERWWY